MQTKLSSLTDEEHEKYSKLVNFVAIRYLQKHFVPKVLSVDDLQQELYFVLGKCIANYDPSKGATFATYFYVSGFRYLYRYVYRSGYPVRLPADCDIKKLKGDYLEQAEACKNANQLSAREKNPNNDLDFSYQYFPLENLRKAEEILTFRKCLEDLDERDKRILKRRLYLNMTLQDVGDIEGISRERVRQIEARGIKQVTVKMRREYK